MTPDHFVRQYTDHIIFIVMPFAAAGLTILWAYAS